MIGLAAILLVAVQDQPTLLRPPAHHMDPPSQYEQVVAQYQRGEYDSAVARVARTPAKAFEKPLEDAVARLWFNALAERHSKMRNITPKPWYDAEDRLLRFLLAVRMLHTEAALRTPLGQMGPHLQLARTADTTLERTQRDLDPHLETSEYLTQAKLARARHDWVVLVALGYHLRSVLDDLPRHLNEAFQRYPEDPALELCLGLYDERIAHDSLVDESLARTVYHSDHVAGWRHLLESALAAYERAARAPDLAAEAHLRIGRIRLQLNEPKQARDALEPLTTSGDSSLIRYLALLLLGDVEEVAKQPNVAIDRYRAALALFPSSQAPFMALSRLSDERGDTAGARDWLEQSLRLPMADRIEPWSLYYAPFMDIKALALSLREQVSR